MLLVAMPMPMPMGLVLIATGPYILKKRIKNLPIKGGDKSKGVTNHLSSQARNPTINRRQTRKPFLPAFRRVD